MSPSAPSASSVKHFSLMFSLIDAIVQVRPGFTRPGYFGFGRDVCYSARFQCYHFRRRTWRFYTRLPLLQSSIRAKNVCCSSQVGFFQFCVQRTSFKFFIESVPTRFPPVVSCGHWLFGVLTTRPSRMSPAWMPTVSCASSG